MIDFKNIKKQYLGTRIVIIPIPSKYQTIELGCEGERIKTFYSPRGKIFDERYSVIPLSEFKPSYIVLNFVTLYKFKVKGYKREVVPGSGSRSLKFKFIRYYEEDEFGNFVYKNFSNKKACVPYKCK